MSTMWKPIQRTKVRLVEADALRRIRDAVENQLIKTNEELARLYEEQDRKKLGGGR